MTVNGIIFDFGFTLFYFDNPSVERYNECFKNGLLKSIDFLKEKQVWNDNLSKEFFVKEFTKERAISWGESRKTKKEFPTSSIYKKIIKSLYEQNLMSSVDHLNEETYHILADIYHSFEMEEWKPFPNTKETLEKLSQHKNLKLGVLSNHPSHNMVKDSLKKYNLFKYFTTVVTSAEIGKRKPDPEVFFYTLEKMGLLDNSDCLVCGDEYSDIVGGDRAGMQTILCERIYKFPYEREINVPNMMKINDISEVLDYLK
ncbi:MAG: HAD family hydrolase [Promethearchaeota archaeon]|jgi:HAD superfamily hydrolase (TIGR01549 family)